MQLPEELRSPKAITLAFGFLGAAFAAATLKDATPWQKMLALAVGFVTAVLFGPPILDLVKAPDGWGYGVGFLIGWVGWAVMGKLISLIRDADMWGLISDILRSWLQRR